ncbi:inner-membrane translocator, partial [Mesorhizobium sp. M00.F.Ca.ET.149.01.1.1]
ADQGLVLEAIAAAVIGGTRLFGGRGSVWAAILGALVIGSIANGMFLINASTQLRLLVQGGVLVAAVIADALIARSGSSSSR